MLTQSTEESRKGTFATGRGWYSRTILLRGSGSSDFRELDTTGKIQLSESYRKLHQSEGLMEG